MNRNRLVTTVSDWLPLHGLLTTGVIFLALFFCADVRADAQVYLADGSQLSPNSATPRGSVPVLFVHGHKPAIVSGDNYINNWQSEYNGLPSFKDALLNNPHLDIEPYYVHFEDQHRSIVEDALDIYNAVERILQRHDPNYRPETETPYTAVKIAIIAYSKGTISSRLYLKSLHESQPGFRPPVPGFNPISEFIALSPPNHGTLISDTVVNIPTIFGGPSTALRQLNNGYTQGTNQNCDIYTDPTDPEVHEFIGQLNGAVPLENFSTGPLGSVPSEAPGSRANGSPLSDGTLYVALFADAERDFVGGLDPKTPPTCRRRVRAANLGSHAINWEVTEIADPRQTDSSLLDSPVHRATVHEPQVMCLALYTVVHHRFPREEDELTVNCEMQDGLPYVPPRVALVHVVDVSGSMLTKACGDCLPKLDVLENAVQVFMDLWAVTAGPGDLVGVQVFGSNVMALDSTQPELSVVSNENVVDINTAVQSLNTTEDQLTAMGGGLQRAIDLLQQPAFVNAQERHVVLFTDGMQNVNPMLVRVEDANPPNDEEFHHEIKNQAGRPASNVNPSPDPHNLRDLQGIKVHTIGVGVTTERFTKLLADIAWQSEATAAITPDPDLNLEHHYTNMLLTALQGQSPQLVAYRRSQLSGDSGEERFVIERQVRRLVFKLSWKEGHRLLFTVHKNGRDLTKTGRTIDRGFYQLFVIDLPARVGENSIDSEGEWQLRLRGPDAANYQVAAIVDQPAPGYSLVPDRIILEAGESLQLKLQASAEGKGLRGANQVQVRISRPADSVGNLLAQVPVTSLIAGAEVEGAGAARSRLQTLLEMKSIQQKLAPVTQTLALQASGEGRFAGTLQATEKPGPYTITLTVTGEDPRLGLFQRQVSITALVRAGDPDPHRSELRLIQKADAAGQRNLELSIVPRDRFGNFMGPDYSDQFHIVVSQKPLSDLIQDELNGTYTIPFELPADDDPNIKIAIRSKTLFTGPLSSLAERPAIVPQALWAVLLIIFLLSIVLLIYRKKRFITLVP